MGLPLQTLGKLQQVQNAAAHMLSGVRRFKPTIPLLRELRWLPVGFLAQFKVAVLIFKVLNSLGPGYLQGHVQHYQPA